jgi:hypothetical protein
MMRLKAQNILLTWNVSEMVQAIDGGRENKAAKQRSSTHFEGNSAC